MHIYLFIFVVSILGRKAWAQTGPRHGPTRVLGEAQLPDPQQNEPRRSETGLSPLTQKTHLHLLIKFLRKKKRKYFFPKSVGQMHLS